MGLGGYITLYNDTGYDLVMCENGYGAYQMRFHSPKVIPAGKSSTFYVEWGQSGSNHDDDSAFTDYVVQDGTGRVVTIEAWARPSKHFQMNFKSYSQPGHPAGDVTNIGWIHDGTVSFRIQPTTIPKPDPCFLSGSLILTPGGYRPVETLRAGDRLVTLENGLHVFREIVFAGREHRMIDVACDLEPDEAGWPVCICANALGNGIPRRDLRVTPEHCLLIDEKFVPVRMLVNGDTIAYDFSQAEFDYFHVATEEHAVIIAENLYTESFLPMKDEQRFGLAHEMFRRNEKPMTPARPIVTDRAIIEPIYREIAKRAPVCIDTGRHFNDVTTDPEVFLALPCGKPIYPVFNDAGTIAFDLDEKVKRVFVRSRADRPCDSIGPYVDDRRRLGVLIDSIMIQDISTKHRSEIDFQDRSLRGWHAPEAAPMRWTKGAAEILIPGALSTGKKRLSLHVLHNEPYRVQR